MYVQAMHSAYVRNQNQVKKFLARALSQIKQERAIKMTHEFLGFTKLYGSRSRAL